MLKFSPIALNVIAYLTLDGQDPLTAGAIKILNYVSTTLLILIPLVAGIMVGITAIKKIQCTDESEAAVLNRRIKTIILYAAVGEVSMGLITWILSYFK